MRDSDPVRALKNDDSLPRVATEPIELAMASAKLLISELDRETEAVRDLIREMCSPRLDAEPSEALKALPMPLACEVAILREPESSRGKLLTSEPVRVSDPEKDLRNVTCRREVEDRPIELGNVFRNPLD